MRPYFGLRSYTDGGAHYDGQIGSEATPAAYVAALTECTREWVRVLKPSGSIFVNLGDKYAGSPSGSDNGAISTSGLVGTPTVRSNAPARRKLATDARPKSLLGLPWRYALNVCDQLGLILRAEIIWAKPNGLPESVTDRVRRAHEQVFHFTRLPRYYSAVDEIRESHTRTWSAPGGRGNPGTSIAEGRPKNGSLPSCDPNPLGKLPGSVWSIPSQPLTVPAHLGVDHFACVDAETEILTPSGWLRHDQLTPGDTVAGYDLGTGTARWTDCSAVNRYDYDGEMVAVESRDLSMRLTPNHRAIVQRMHTRSKQRSPETIVRADELDRYHFIPRSAPWERCGDFYVGDRLAAVLGWVAAEGWYQGSRVYLSQSLEMNAENVAAISKLIPDAPRTDRKRIYKGRPWTEVTWRLGLIGGSFVQREMPDKLLPWWLVTATEPERRAVLDAFIAGDGHRRADGRIGIYQKLRHNLDVLQAIAVTLGYKTTLREGCGRFVLYLTEGGRSVTLRGTSGVGSKIGREHYTGTVWCPSTGTGTFIARRNGSVFVTGNSFPLELPRRIIAGWSPPGVCCECGEGRRPVVRRGPQPPEPEHRQATRLAPGQAGNGTIGFRNSKLSGQEWNVFRAANPDQITGYACACPQPGAPMRPALVLDPFGGTGTTALAATVLGRHAITIDRSADYCRLAAWRTRDPGERARAMHVPKPPPVPADMDTLFELP